MLIAIEAERANIDNPTGVEHYAKSLILELAQIDSQNNYVLYLRTAPRQWLLELPANFKVKVLPFPIAWTQVRLSWEILWHRPDVLFIPASSLPIIHPKNSVVTVHDLAWDKFPETFNAWRLFTLRLFTWYAAKFAKTVIAISEQTKQDLIAKYKLPEQKIQRIYHGFSVDELNYVFSEQDQKEDAEKLKALPEKFILYLGTLQPRKNPQGLIDAVVELKEQGKIEHSLVLVGGKGWMYESILEKIAQHSKDVIYLGYIKDRFKVLKKAALLVQPAFYEGMGLQVFDAFAVSVPVASSNAPALPEACGDAAIYFDPNSKESMQQAMLKALTDQQLRQSLITKGKQRLAQFTWKHCAELTLSAITGARINV